MNDNKSNQIVSADENRSDGDNSTEEYQAYEKLVKETVDYESLEVTHHDDMRQVDEIVNLIVETVMCKNDKILIASNWYPASLVKKKFLMLTYSHIEYFLHCMSGNTTKVKNIKKYLLAALFNAPSTMNGNNTFSCHVQYSIYEHSCKQDQIQNNTQRKQEYNLYPVMVTVCSCYNQQSEYKTKDSPYNRISLYCHLHCQADHKKDQPYRQ